jgi:hypothetical protein
MKKLYKRAFLLSIFTLLSFVAVKAQTLEDVTAQLRSGNVGAMTKYFDNIVTITITNTPSAYSKTQAEMVLRDFFSKNAPKDFVVMQSGTAPNNNCKYAIGNLITSNGNYQLYILLKLKESAFLLQEIRIEK